MNRKDFIKRGFQLGILTILGAGTSYLHKRGQIDIKCTESSCGSCLKLAECNLDRAKNLKEHGRIR